MKLKRHRLFIKDFRSLTLADSQFDKLIYFLSVLRKGDPLPEESKDHALLGEWSDFREFHIGGDMLVIYRVIEEEVVLTRIGTHAKLFE
ncbi:type II toxin-antitoxin system YafQ family toxin [Thiofilum flexile]|uniref:type II toxin-antitoxin system YafQ family toxin n=1 Tax=Thiofilum flexile TaxID=125627 RepID=UPI00036E01BE|nr:type II toxin-antitoxin system YafQ family toxin [Thiofilum flexile]